MSQLQTDHRDHFTRSRIQPNSTDTFLTVRPCCASVAHCCFISFLQGAKGRMKNQRGRGGMRGGRRGRGGGGRGRGGRGGGVKMGDDDGDGYDEMEVRFRPLPPLILMVYI